MKIEIDVLKGKITEFSNNKATERNISNATFVLEGNLETSIDITKEYNEKLIEENLSLRNELNKTLIKENERLKEDINILTRTFPNKLTTDINCKHKTYKEYLHSSGWDNKLVILDENDEDNICEYIKINESGSTYLINIKFPQGTKITIDPGYIFGLLILDKDGKEIPDNTKIRIIKDIPSDDISTLLEINYSDIKMNNGNSGYIFNKGFAINAQYHLIITTIQRPDVPKKNIMFRLMFDYWIRY